jgi:hypothetical protein
LGLEPGCVILEQHQPTTQFDFCCCSPTPDSVSQPGNQQSQMANSGQLMEQPGDQP